VPFVVKNLFDSQCIQARELPLWVSFVKRVIPRMFIGAVLEPGVMLPYSYCKGVKFGYLRKLK
jgi:hypothetical protein